MPPTPPNDNHLPPQPDDNSPDHHPAPPPPQPDNNQPANQPRPDKTNQPHRPPWHQHHDNHNHDWRQHKHEWNPRRGRRIFFRLLSVFGLMALLVLGGMALLAYLITSWMGGTGSTAIIVWLIGCGVAAALPLSALALAINAFRRIAIPLASLMSAAEAVGRGDFTVRIEEQGKGDFRPLVGAFNRMTEELGRVDQQRRNLTADIAHELRTPLHIIQGNLEGILDDIYQPTPEHIQATLDETHHLSRLVTDLRTLSQAESGELPLTLEEIDLHEFFTDLETSFTGAIHQHNLTLTIDTPNHPLTLTADYGRLNQIFSNLLMNAIRHTPAEGEIHITAYQDKETLTLTLRDTGQGIPPDDLPYIFDRFWRGDRARTHTDGAGGGLGLAIVRQLVHLHNGHIDATSQENHGTTFTLQFPRP